MTLRPKVTKFFCFFLFTKRRLSLPLGLDPLSKPEIPLCRLADIEDGGSRGFLPQEWTDQIFAVRRGDEVFIYLNSCPHQWIELDYAKDRFLSGDRRTIMCFAHGAHFAIATGECVAGVCEGDRLIPVPHRLEGGWILIPAELPSHPTLGSITD